MVDCIEIKQTFVRVYVLALAGPRASAVCREPWCCTIVLISTSPLSVSDTAQRPVSQAHTTRVLLLFPYVVKPHATDDESIGRVKYATHIMFQVDEPSAAQNSVLCQ